MIAGRGTPDLAPARLFAYRASLFAFGELIDRSVQSQVALVTRPWAPP